MLVSVSQYVMTIPHSMQVKDEFFSLINKNKAPSRSFLLAENTLFSLLIFKTHIEDPLKWSFNFRTDPEGQNGYKDK